MSSYDYAGRTALVTGASSGIGEAFARELVGRCARVIVVSRASERLDAVVGRLSGAGSAQVCALPLDLSSRGVAESLRTACARNGWQVDVLINNAGLGTFGRFDEVSAEADTHMVAVNAVAATEVLHAFVPDMVARRDGVIINTASSAALQPTPWFATYGATKAYLLSLSESLSVLYRHEGIRITAACPGPVDTAFFDNTHSDIEKVRFFDRRISPDAVVRGALRAIDRRQPVVFYDALTRANHFASRFAPRSVVARISERVLRPPKSTSR